MKLVICFIVAICATATFATMAFTDEYYVDENDTKLYYRAEDGFITLTECSGLGNGRNLNLPASIEGLKVVSIADDFLNGLRQSGNGRTWGDIVIPEGITNIGNRAFYQLEVHTFSLPASLVSIGDSAFYNATVFGGSISIPPNVSVIGNKAFYGCYYVTAIELRSSDLTLGAEAFSGCYRLKCAVLPDSLKRIPDGLFYGCDELETVNIPTSVESIGASAFLMCNKLQAIALPEGLTWIGEEAFWGCQKIESISIPGSVEEVGVRAFSGCVRVNELTIFNGVKEIGAEAFSGLSISSVTIPKSVRFIGRAAFTSPDSVVIAFNYPDVDPVVDFSFYVDPENENYKAVEGVLFSKDGKVLELYPNAKNKRGMKGWAIVNETFLTPSGIERIGKGSCVRRKNDTIIVQEGVANIDDYAFADSEVDVVELPSTVELIGEYAFSGCSSVAGDGCLIKLPNGVRAIGKGAFNGSVISELYIPDNVLEVSDGLCKECDYLRSIHISTNAVRIGAEAFAYCSSMTRVDIPDSVERIEDYAFSHCSSLARVDFYGTLPKDIGEFAFYGCSSDIEIHVPKDWDGGATWRGYAVVADLDGSAKSTDAGEGTGDTEIPQTIVVTNCICMTVTNVVVHYILNSVQAEIAVPLTPETDFVNIVAEVKANSAVAIPSSWAANYPRFVELFGSDFTQALTKQTGKIGAGNVPMLVWQDYVAGTDPTDKTDIFKAYVTMVDGKPVISWTPELKPEQAALRKYTTYGKTKLTDKDWTVVNTGDEDKFNFFKVTVEMTK